MKYEEQSLMFRNIVSRSRAAKSLAQLPKEWELDAKRFTKEQLSFLQAELEEGRRRITQV